MHAAQVINLCTSELKLMSSDDIDRAPFEKEKNIGIVVDRWTYKEIVVISPGCLSRASCNTEC